jgi:hypothetical protein
MALMVTPVPRNLATKVTFLYLEFEDLFVILGLAVVMNMFGRFLQREMFGIPMNVFLHWCPAKIFRSYVNWHLIKQICHVLCGNDLNWEGRKQPS